ncbi:MAG TPA: chemotaxis protein CheB, partial [Accumulibacter sp.]|nr:chemotaxis protein CheB [Accumulibacter sp.]
MSNANQDEAKKGRPSSRRAPPVGASADNEGAHARSDERPFIVGIGASAGGLEALSLLLPGLPKNLGLTYVVVQHLSPTYRSMMSQLL